MSSDQLKMSTAENTCDTWLFPYDSTYGQTLDAAWASRPTVNVSVYENNFAHNGTLH
jgi:hypothetical protein